MTRTTGTRRLRGAIRRNKAQVFRTGMLLGPGLAGLLALAAIEAVRPNDASTYVASSCQTRDASAFPHPVFAGGNDSITCGTRAQ